MRFTDLMLTLPQLPLLLVLSSSLRQFVQLQKFLGSNLSVVIIIFVLVLFGWMGVARLVRGSVLSLRGQDVYRSQPGAGRQPATVSSSSTWCPTRWRRSSWQPRWALAA